MFILTYQLLQCMYICSVGCFGFLLSREFLRNRRSCEHFCILKYSIFVHYFLFLELF